MGKNINKNKILSLLIFEDQLSRSEIASKLKISESVISYLIREMNQKKLITMKKRILKKGRPKEIISVNPDIFISLGIKMGRESVRGIVFNAKFNVLEREEIFITKNLRNEDGYRKVLNHILSKFSNFLIKIVGISSSGLIENGKIYSKIMNLDGLEVDKLVYNKLGGILGGICLLILNDVEAIALYEKNFHKKNNFLIVNYGTGIGASYFYGKKSYTFELGHLIVRSENPQKCYCGQYGCLETVASDYANLKRYLKADFSISEFVEYEEEKYREKLEEMRKLSENPSKEILNIYEESLKYLSIQIGNLLSILNPEEVLFYGEGIKCWMVKKIENNIRNEFRYKKITEVKFTCQDDSPEIVYELGSVAEGVLKYIKERKWDY